jgi:hypothetical protein
MNKLYTCQHCKRENPAGEFYSLTDKKGERVSPFCRSCNTEACLFQKYKREARRDPGTFARKIRNKETQLDQMVKALREVRV